MSRKQETLRANCTSARSLLYGGCLHAFIRSRRELLIAQARHFRLLAACINQPKLFSLPFSSASVVWLHLLGSCSLVHLFIPSFVDFNVKNQVVDNSVVISEIASSAIPVSVCIPRCVKPFPVAPVSLYLSVCLSLSPSVAVGAYRNRLACRVVEE